MAKIKHHEHNEHHEENESHNPYEPYKIFTQNQYFSPFLLSHKMLQTWFELNQKIWQNYLEWTMWRNKAVLEAYFENTRWMMHVLQLGAQPQIMYRYLRANWQKPFVSLNAQALTSARMLTHMMMENGTLFQKSVGSILKEKQSQTHH